MLFMDLDFGVQTSFLASVRKTLTDFLTIENYAFVEDGGSFVTADFVYRVVEDLQEKRSFQQWAQVDFEIDMLEMTGLLQKMEQSMRARSSTLKQRNYFYTLLADLGMQEELPLDYLYLKRRLLEMQELKDQLKKEERASQPATVKQIHTIQKVWRKTFREELELSADVTQGEVQQLFNQANSHADYGKWR
ncbi:hypothetical protein [Bacillus thuringiensis]|uniref:Uncharacterized protein n=1 Tax=Bacillus thuringiensis subsp. higo TaxID=132266 RepID=A0A9X6LR59_BACUH|nr:hypothetical protein [Bacillus thuringiensis]OUB50126.1 hypothetical protein BK716_15415 [Bacillus thuringiensis serovar higo]